MNDAKEKRLVFFLVFFFFWLLQSVFNTDKVKNKLRTVKAFVKLNI